MEMAAATWELADEEEEGQCFPSGPPARGGERRGGEEREAAPGGSIGVQRRGTEGTLAQS